MGNAHENIGNFFLQEMKVHLLSDMYTVQTAVFKHEEKRIIRYSNNVANIIGMF
jgi:hypothetical protein